MKRLSESIWSNINKRSEGNIERKEDDVDLMDGENFAIYLNKRYSFKNGHKIEYDKKLRTLTIPGLYTEDEFFYDNVGVDYENDSMTLRYMWINDPALTVQVRSALKKRYNLSSKESSYIFISPLNGGELTNKFVVNVLDYMADLDINDINIRRTVNESIWSNINKRSEGSIERKEDDINLLDVKGFRDYLKKSYNNLEDIPISCGDKYINVPVFIHNHSRRILLLYPEMKRAQVRLQYYEQWPEDLRKYLDENYNVEKSLDEHRDWMYFIKSKDGDGDNKFFIKLLDDILKNVKKPLLKKIVNESIWSNINKRSEGSIERKEDQLITNIKEIEPVDLGSDVPVYFADRDLEVNGEIEFTWDEVLGFILQIEKTGWELPTGPKGMQYLFYFGNQPPRFNDEDYKKKWIPSQGGILTSRENNVELHFPSNNKHVQSYWCADDDYKKGDLDTYMIKMSGPHVTARSFEVGNPNDYFGCLIRTNNQMVNKKCRIRLIRDK